MKQIETALSSKYQVTIPTEIRAELGIDSPNYNIVWLKIPNGLFAIQPVKKLAKGENPFMRMFGILEKYGNGHEVEDFIAEKRAEALKDNE
jgi:bifunctional DNA-binding transcriptional regulator/antitoxin component of YhaV-PrlF toxin-antitoxin module